MLLLEKHNKDAKKKKRKERKKKKKNHLTQIQGHCHKYGLQKFITLITIGIF